MEKVKLMFFAWDSFYGKLIRLGTGSKWTHIGIISREDNNGYECFEAVNEGLVKSYYSKELVDKWVETGIVTIKEVSVGNARRLRSVCQKFEGRPYDWISIFNIAWYKLFGKMALNFKGPRAVICSEFVARVLYDISASKIDLSKEYDKPMDLITPAEIFESEYIKGN